MRSFQKGVSAGIGPRSAEASSIACPIGSDFAAAERVATLVFAENVEDPLATRCFGCMGWHGGDTIRRSPFVRPTTQLSPLSQGT